MKEPIIQEKGTQRQLHDELARRDFVASVAAGLAVAAGTASAALPVTEKDVEIKTPDGTCDAAYIHPTTGSHAAVNIWSDAFGLRPVLRDIGKRIAAEGYTVLVPNPFYRVKAGPAVDNPSTFDFATGMKTIQPLMASIGAPGACRLAAFTTRSFGTVRWTSICSASNGLGFTGFSAASLPVA